MSATVTTCRRCGCRPLTLHEASRWTSLPVRGKPPLTMCPGCVRTSLSEAIDRTKGVACTGEPMCEGR